MIGVLNHPIALLELLLSEISGMALITGLEHGIAFFLPILLGELRHFGGLHHFEAGSRFAVWVEHAESLQDGYLVSSSRFIFRQRQANGEESPRGIHVMVAVAHVAGLASWRGNRGRESAGLFQAV